MNRKIFEMAIWLPWVALPTTALNYWRSWDRLPMRMAVHFDANWQPNGWTSREGSLLFALGLIAFMLVVCTGASYFVLALNPRPAWLALIALYVGLGFCWYGSNAIVKYNLQTKQHAQHAARLGVEVLRGSGERVQVL